MVKKKIITKKVHCCHVSIDSKFDKIDHLSRKFSKRNLPKNIIKCKDKSGDLALVITEKTSKLLKGVFIKLKNKNPKLVNRKTSFWRKIFLKPDQSIFEESHFVYFFDDNMILAVSNRSGILYFSAHLDYYLNETLGVKDTNVGLIAKGDTYSRLAKKKKIKYISIQEIFSPPTPTFLESVLSADVGKTLKTIFPDTKVKVTLSLQSYDKPFLRNAIKEFVKIFQNKKGKDNIIKSLSFGDKANPSKEHLIDLIKENLLIFPIDVERDYETKGGIVHPEIFDKIEEIYAENSDIILKAIAG